MGQTNRDVEIVFRGRNITVPKGTRTTHVTACGVDENYNFVDEFSWIPKIELPGGRLVIDQMMLHDATYYGIDIPKEYVTE